MCCTGSQGGIGMQKTALAILLALIGVAPAATAQTQQYPTGTIRIIAPAPPGSPRDVRARWTAEQLGSALGQPVMVDNRAGAGGNIGMEAAAKSAPDGRTLVIVDNGTLAMNPHLYERTGYDALADFIPVVRLVEAPLMLAVRADLPVRSVADLIRLAKEKPGQLTYGSPGVGTPPHLANELFKRTAGIDVAHVPYKGMSPALTDLMAGRIDYMIDNVGLLSQQVAAGKIRALAITGPRRIAAVPDVPTMAEAGLPGYEFTAWMGVAVPAGTPAAIVQRLNAELVRALRSPGGKAWFEAQGGEIVADSPEAFAQAVRSEHARWREVIQGARIKAE
jgi:tripartite-type tricarboxylate transporter receptor subunit TctC